MKIYTVEQQPNFGDGPIVGIWETSSVHHTEAGARASMERAQSVYGRLGKVVVMRVASREVLP